MPMDSSTSPKFSERFTNLNVNNSNRRNIENTTTESVNQAETRKVNDEKNLRSLSSVQPTPMALEQRINVKGTDNRVQGAIRKTRRAASPSSTIPYDHPRSDNNDREGINRCIADMWLSPEREREQVSQLHLINALLDRIDNLRDINEKQATTIGTLRRENSEFKKKVAELFEELQEFEI